jgi:phosphatidylinositol alpha 1,6-mannosyltransferase
VPVPSVALPFRSEYRLALGLSPAARRELQAFQPTLFHVSVPDLLGVSALRTAKRLGCPIVGSYHTRFDTYCRYYGLGWFEKYMLAHLRHFYNSCDQVFAPSASMVNVLTEQGIGRDVRPWSRGVDRVLFDPGKRDLSWRRSLGITDEEVVVAFVGRLVLEKGLRHFADVHRALKAGGVAHRILVVGEGPARDKMQEWVPDGIFTGFLDGENLARAYASSDLIFNPSVTEAFGNVTVEAMACGVTPVCSRTAGHLSIVADGVTGYLTTPNDISEATERLASLASDADLRRRMGAAARAASQRFSWDTVMDAIYGYYLEAVQPGVASEAANLAGLPGKTEPYPAALSKTGT